MAVNKVVYGNNTLIDLTADTVTADKLAQGYTAHDASGATITGTMSGSADPTYKRWVYTNPSLVNTTTQVTLLTDSWIAEHYNDDNLEIIVTNLSKPDKTSSTICFIICVARNTSFVSGATVYQSAYRCGNNSDYGYVITSKVGGATSTTRGTVGAYSDGTVKIRVTSSGALPPGNYEIVARLY